jgi:phage terminase large subunit-like protein
MVKEIDPFELLGDKLRTSAKRPNINSYEPHEKQREFHESTATVTQYIGGNRSGKTTGGVAEDIWYAKGEHPYKRIPEAPNAMRVCASDFNVGLGQVLLPELARWCPPSLLKNGSWEDSYKKEPPELHFANRSFIEFKSYEQALVKFAGTSRDLIHHDEEPPQDIYKENLMRIIDCNGRMTLTMTPVEGMTWTYDQIYHKGKPEDESVEPDKMYHIIEADMLDNPYIGEVEAQLVLSGLDPDELKARKAGKYVMIGGLIYPGFNQNMHVIDDFQVPANWNIYASMDHGLSNPTAWLWHTVDPIGRIITFAEHYANEMTIDEHAVAYHKMNEQLQRYPEYNVGDPSIKNRNAVSMTSVQQEYIKNGIFIILGNNDVMAGINRVRTYQKPGKDGKPMWLVTKNCPKLIWETSRYRKKKYANSKIAAEHNAPEEPIDRDNHALDAVRYFMMSRPDIRILGPAQAGLDRMGNVLRLPAAIPAVGRVANPRGREASIWETFTPANKQQNWQTDEYVGGDW